VDSFGWNLTEEWLLEDKIPTNTKIKTLLARSRDLPGIASFVQPHIKTLVELNLNHSFFFNDDIVPRWMVDRYKNQPERQTWPTTPELYNKIGKAVRVSPIKIQYAVRNIFTRQMQDAVRLLDTKPYEAKADWPVAGRLFTRPSEGWSSQSVKTVAEMDSQWTILRSRLAYIQEDKDVDEAKEEKLESEIARLTIGHQVMHEIDDLWGATKTERKKAEPDLNLIKSLKRKMTEKARKFTVWDKGGRKGKLPAGIISNEYRRSLVKQGKMRPSPRRSGEPFQDYQARREKVLGQKNRALNLLKLL